MNGYVGICAQSECKNPPDYVFEVDGRPSGVLKYVGACKEHKKDVLNSAAVYVIEHKGSIHQLDWKQISDRKWEEE